VGRTSRVQHNIQIKQRKFATGGGCDINDDTWDGLALRTVVSEAVSGHDRVLKVCHSLHLLSKGDLHGGFDQKDWNNTVVKAIKTRGVHVVQPDQHVLWETFQCDDGAVPKQGLFRIKNYINNGTPCPVAMLLVS